MKVIFISYDGMTDPLGQSQVLPYLVGLSVKGVQVTLVSLEKKARFKSGEGEIKEIVRAAKINWVPLPYYNKVPIISALSNTYRLKREVFKLHRLHQFDLVHCRSYLSAMVGASLKQKTGVPMLFDMRGFWPDERVEGKVWNLKNPIYGLVYRYFKMVERKLLSNADKLISLTHEGKKVISEKFKISPSKTVVIPCCADDKLFNAANVTEEEKSIWRTRLDVKEDDFVFTYLGSVGTWYMVDEMMAFWRVFQQICPQLKILFITKDEPQILFDLATKHGVNPDIIRVKPSGRNEVPVLLSLSSASLFFILPTYSKKASSPTKMGEILNMGIPIVCNGNVGDNDLIMKEILPQLVVNALDENTYEIVGKNLLEYLAAPNPEALRRVGTSYFSLEKGIETYFETYHEILNSNQK